MGPSIVIFVFAGLLLIAGPALSQQPETGPKGVQDGHPMRTPETGTRGPSGGSPDTGYHGPRDVTKDREPGKKQSSDERRQTGQAPAASPRSN